MKKKSFQSKNISIKKKITDVLGVPDEVILGAPIVTVTGNYALSVMNYLAIIEYTDERIRLRTKTGQIKISGKCLEVIYYTNDEMKISGKITSMEYC